ncbi:MAG: hypothetical protein HYV54_01440 [Parcubacteria group bacterium]|nr:hypothetical protein [Parcubacteria group bacterium]
MSVIIDFLTDGAKIVFGSTVVGFFIPGITSEVTKTMFIAGGIVTAVFLILAVILSKQVQKS